MSLFLISCVKHIYQTHNTFHPNVVGYSSFWKISCIIEFLPQIDSNPQPMSYFRPQEEVGHETSKHGYWVHKIVQPNIVGYTCSRRDKCLFNFQHHWNAVHRVRPRSSELCNWMPYSVFFRFEQQKNKLATPEQNFQTLMDRREKSPRKKKSWF